MADENVDTGNTGKSAEEIAVQAAVDQKSTDNNGAAPASPEGGQADDQNLSNTDQGKVNDAQAQHSKDGTWPEDTPSWVKERVNKTTRKFYNEKQRADTAEQETARLREENEKLKNAPKDLGEKPQLGNYDSEEDYMDALTDWKLDKRDQDNATKRQENKSKNTQQEAKEAFEKKMDNMLDKGQGKYEDFLPKIQSVPGNIFRTDVVDAVAEAENSDDVLYFLSDNLTEAAKIAELNPTQRAIEIGKLSARLSAKPPVKQSNAPEPINAGGSKSNGPVDESKLSDEEYFAKKESEMIASG